MSKDKTVLIIGAGPAGLTAALEIIRRGEHLNALVVEATDTIGGISQTVNFKGYRMDIGGHRFFSKSDWVMNWWKSILPVEQEGNNAGKNLLIRNRLSRIYYLRKFFDYPIKLSLQTLMNLGGVRAIRIGLSYIYSILFPRKPEVCLEDFIVNRFGKELYLTFFKDYTEKVWGVSCREISAEWGAQRIKGLSITKAVIHAIKTPFQKKTTNQKETNTSLIESFFYPKLGPGQLWEEVAEQVISGGGKLLMNHRATKIHLENNQVHSVTVTDQNGKELLISADYVISTMPVSELIAGIDGKVPDKVQKIAKDLPYRDFLTVGLLLKKMKHNPQSRSVNSNECPPDNWIYVQESDVLLGRIQVFNNWSPYLVQNQDHIWLGLEYFCQQNDELWNKTDEEMSRFAIFELEKIGLIHPEDVLDAHVVRVPKTYPAYFGTYKNFGEIRSFVDTIQNLFLIGRNGMHRYNNMDHSMLTAKMAVDAIFMNSFDKSAIWSVNIDDEYHEEK